MNFMIDWQEQYKILFLPIEHKETYLRTNVSCSFRYTEIVTTNVISVKLLLSSLVRIWKYSTRVPNVVSSEF